jgi:hypothetical protein
LIRDKRYSTLYEFLLRLEKKSPIYYKELERMLPRIHSNLPSLIKWGLKRGVIEECEPPAKEQKGRGWFYGRKKLPRKESGLPPQKYYRITDHGKEFLKKSEGFWNLHKRAQNEGGKFEMYAVPKGSKEYDKIKKRTPFSKSERERAKWMFLYILSEWLKEPQK